MVGAKLQEQSTRMEGWKVGSFSVSFHGLSGSLSPDPLCLSFLFDRTGGVCLHVEQKTAWPTARLSPQRNTRNLLSCHFVGLRVRCLHTELCSRPLPKSEPAFPGSVFWALISGQGGGAPPILSHHMKVKSDSFLFRKCQERHNTRVCALEPVSQ